MYRVLVADDEQMMRDAMRLMISRIPNFQVVHSVGSGEEAVECCRRDPIDIVFLDMELVGMSGIEACKRIHKYHPDISIYMVSVCRDFEFARGILRSAAQEYLSKPVAFSTLRALLEEFAKYHQGTVQQINLLSRCLNQHDFRGMYYAVPELVRQICVDKDQRRLTECFFQMGESLLGLVPGLNPDGTACERLFPINEIFARNPKSWEMWLFDVMNYVFQQAAVSRCEILEDVFRFINLRIKGDLSLAVITRACNISQGYLSRLFQQYLSMSVMEYLHIRKLALAKMYLIFTNMSTADVAFRLGYSESNYFSKVFKRYENVTAHEYRKRHAADILANE